MKTISISEPGPTWSKSAVYMWQKTTAVSASHKQPRGGHIIDKESEKDDVFTKVGATRAGPEMRIKKFGQPVRNLVRNMSPRYSSKTDPAATLRLRLRP
jgi:hypothetical protein